MEIRSYIASTRFQNIFFPIIFPEEKSLSSILEEQANRRITYAVTQIEPLGYHEKISPILECEPETALLVLKQMHFDETDELILYSVNYFRADKFSFQVLRKRV
jgi:GntR family transcriptional regulator